MKKKIVYVVGTRPEFIRSAFIIKRLKKDTDVNCMLVHTGQHYNYNMDGMFFEELDLPKPDVNLEVGSETHAKQTAEIMRKFEDFLNQFRPGMVAVFGDTNSTLATALAAVKMKIPVAHLEAGCREWEMDIPEEINRIVVDHVANVLLPVSKQSYRNLIAEKVRGAIIQTGDPLYDVFNFYKKQTVPSNVASSKPYILLTLHRDKNIDDIERFKAILSCIDKVSPVKVVYPCHPRAMEQLKKHNIHLTSYKHICFIEPVGYQETIRCIRESEFIITDSGGLQKEAFWSKRPCIVLRTHTAWVEPVEMGVNFVTGQEIRHIEKVIKTVIKNYLQIKKRFVGLANPYYKKNALEIIVGALKKYAETIS
jgi:UDP-GlcNAc3NAcA epimerase